MTKYEQMSKDELIKELIEKQQKLEENLRESEASYRVIFETSRDAIMTLEPPLWNFTRGNPATIELFRAKDETEFISCEPWKLSPLSQPDGRPSDEKAKEMINTAMRKGFHFFEWNHKRFDGEEFPATVLLTRVEYGGKEFLLATVRDITHQKEMEKTLRESKERYISLFEQAGDGIFILNTMGKIISVNEAFARLHGFSVEEILDMGLEKLDVEGTSPVPDRIRRVMSGEPLTFEVEHYHKKGHTIPLSVTANLISTGKEQFIIAIHRDITERKLAEKIQRENEKCIKTKLDAILLPDGDIGMLELSEIIDYESLQLLMDDFHRLTGIGIAILDIKGKILVATGWQDICTKFHRVHPETRNNCIESDTILSNNVNLGEFRLYKCKNNMWDISTPIMIDDKHVGNLFLGQFFFEGETPDYEVFRLQAKRYGFNEEAYIDALNRVPRFSRDTINTVMTFYIRFASIISNLSISNIRLARTLTERDNLIDLLRESDNMYRLLADNVSDMITLHAKDGTYIYVSPACRTLLGYEPEYLIGKNPYDFFHPDDISRIRVSHKSVLNNNFYTVEYRLRGKDDSYHWMETNNKAVVNSITNEVENIICITRDISSRKNLESQLRQAQKMEAIGTLAGGIAHDFNNILAAIIGYTELSLDLAEDALLKSNLYRVIESGKRAKELVRQILTFSRKLEQKEKPVIINSLIKEAVSLLRASLPTTIEIKYISGDNSVILADPTQIHQIIMNLGTNAFHAMKKYGGILEIKQENILLKEEEINLYSGLKPGFYVRLIISDTGEGIPSEYIEKIFEPYFTTKEVGEGTGLGLSVVHGIVKSHGGNIKVYSEPGKGARFEILFPEIKTEVNVADKSILHPPGGKESIIVVDDEEYLVEILQKILKLLGYKVTARQSGIDALDTFRKGPDNFDMVITDLTMPKMTGRELAEELHKIKPDLPVILCTGNQENMSIGKSKETGISDYIIKPFTRDDLALTIRRVLDKKTG